MTIKELRKYAKVMEEQAPYSKDPKRARILSKIAEQRADRREAHNDD